MTMLDDERYCAECGTDVIGNDPHGMGCLSGGGVACDALGCDESATTVVSVGCPQPAAYCDRHAALEAVR